MTGRSVLPASPGGAVEQTLGTGRCHCSPCWARRPLALALALALALLGDG